MQLIGLFLTQYAADEGSSSSVFVYALLFFQVFLSAASSIYNESLVKDATVSLHAQNAALYSVGTVVNLIIHIFTKIVSTDEPWIWEGYGQIGAVLVIVSNVAIGLAITAVYKCK